ncbi:MAG TPA: hypothetical protein VEU33_03365 [Archangium sp.]|nr:hypothetical protein [Archangium sp.]
MARDSLDVESEQILHIQVLAPEEPPAVISASDMSWENKDLLIKGKTVTIDGAHTFRNVFVLTNGVLTHSAQTTSGSTSMDLTVSEMMMVDASSSVDVSGKGYQGGLKTGDAMAARGRTVAVDANGVVTERNVLAPVTNASGSHGGYGGHTTGSPMPLYNDLRDPHELGSGGAGNASFTGGTGGGLVRIKVKSLVLNGAVKANGVAGSYRGGSGGGVKLDVEELSGSGSVEANGGQVGNTDAGGGGRVAVLYGTNLGFDFTKLYARGSTHATMGGVGTVFTKAASQTHGELRLISNSTPSGGLPTPVPAGNYDRFVTGGGSQVSVPGDLVATWATFNLGTTTISGSVSVQEVSFAGGTLNLGGAFSTQQVGTLTVGTKVTFNALSAPNVTGLTVDKADVAFTTPWPLNSGIPLMVTGSGAVLTLWGEDPVLLDSLSVTDGGKLMHAAATTTRQHRLELVVAKEAFIGASSFIDVSGKGYLGGPKSADLIAARGRTVVVDANGVKHRNVPALVNDANGSYGGYGWTQPNEPAAEVYGDFRDPDDLGSGGAGNSSSSGGNGGGLVRLKAAKLTLIGSVLANGSSGVSGTHRSGSGGGVKLEVGELSGTSTGTVEASGSANNPGGGGRVAVYYTTNTGFDLSKVYAATGWSASGGAGTVFIKRADQLYGELGVNNLKAEASITPAKATPVPGGTYDRFVSSGAASVVLSSGLVAKKATFGVGSVTTIPGDLTLEEQVFFTGGTLNLAGAFSTPQPGLLSIGTSVMFGTVWAPNVTELTVDKAAVVFTQLWPLRQDIPLTVTGAASSLSLWGSEPLRLASLSLLGGGTLTHAATTATREHRLELEVTGTVTIDATSAIDVTGKGYPGGIASSVASETRGRTVLVDASGKKQRNVLSPVASSGGSYGGYGYYLWSVASTPVYGDMFDPDDLGSGGSGDAHRVGGRGGGLVRLKASKLALAGKVRANGGWSNAYGGSGGGVKLEVGELSGNGGVEASGAAYSAGGGRIAVYYASNLGPDLLPRMTASGAGSSQSYWDVGGPGTIYVKKTGEPYGEVSVTNSSAADAKVLPTPVPGGTYKRFLVGDGAKVALSSGLVAEQVSIGASSQVTIPGDLLVSQQINFLGGTLSLAGAFSTPQPGTLTLGSSVTFGSFSAPNVTELKVLEKAVVAFTQPWPLRQNIPVTVTGSGAVLSLWGEEKLKFSSLTLSGGGKLTHAAATVNQSHWLDLEVVTKVSIDSSSSIEVNGKGLLGGPRTSDLVAARGRTVRVDSDGVKLRNVPALVNSAAGSHGGYGYSGTIPITPMEVYDDPYDPSEPGAGGAGTADGWGGAGGGLVRIKTDILELQGKVTANGTDGWNGYSGAGGGVKLEVTTVSGNGVVEAKGGYQGGGGRVALLYKNNLGFTLTKMTAASGINARGGAGTVFAKDIDSQTYGEFFVYNGTYDGIHAKATPVPAGTYDRLAITGGARAALLGDVHATVLDLSGLGYVEPAGSLSTDNAGPMTIGTSVTFNTFSAPSVTELKVDRAAVAFTTPWPLRQDIPVTVTGYKSELSLWGSDKLKLYSLMISDGGKLTHAAATDTQVHRIDLEVTDKVTVAYGSSINVNGKGYSGGAKSSDLMAVRGRTVRVGSDGVKQHNVPALVSGAAGSYGGYGQASGTPMEVYGDFRDPDDLGSGGAGSSSEPGGAGGGLVRIKAKTLELIGKVEANSINDGAHLAGSGGGVKFDVVTLSGWGTVEAKGYNEGGGGRIAVYYGTNNGFPLGNLVTNASGSGGVGTIFTKSTVQEFGSLELDRGGGSGYDEPTPVPGGTYDALTVTGGAKVRFLGDVYIKSLDASGPGNMQSTGALSIDNTSLTLATDGTFATFTAPKLTALTVSNVPVSFTQPWAFNDGVELSVTGSSGVLTLWGEQQVKLSKLTLSGGAKLKHAAATETQTHRLDLDVSGEVSILGTTSSIDVSGRGYLGGPKTSDPVAARGRTVVVDSSGVTQRNVPVPLPVTDVHGSHGGYGAAPLSTQTVPMETYDDPLDPNEPGSGGCGNGSHAGGNGGGLVRLKASSLVLNGTVKANGDNSSGYSGAGGGVKLEVGTLSGTGSVEALGSGLAGGGLISVLYGTNSGFELTRLSAKSSGTGGGAGLVYTRKTSGVPVSQGVLTVDNAQTGLSTARATSVPAGTYDTLTIKGRSRVRAQGDLVVGNLDLQNSVVDFPGALTLSNTGELVLSSDATFAGVVSAPNLTDLTVSSSSLTRFLQAWNLRPDVRVTVKNTSTLSLGGNTVFAMGSLKLLDSATVTHEAVTTTHTHRLELAVAGEVAVGASAKIDVTGKGYLGGYMGANQQYPGRTLDNLSVPEASGSYGGYGYSAYAGTSGAPMATYGVDFTNPDEHGSGGAAYLNGVHFYKGGNGGGLVRLSAHLLTLDGKILANGTSDGNSIVRGGSGGGVWLNVGTLTGAGEVQARGSGGHGFSGGGGRIALLYGQVSSAAWLDRLLTSPSGNGAGAGTVYTRKTAPTVDPATGATTEPAQVYGALIIDNGNFTPHAHPTPLEDPTGYNTLTLDRLVVRKKASARTDDRVVVPTGQLVVETGSTFVHPPPPP